MLRNAFFGLALLVCMPLHGDDLPVKAPVPSELSSLGGAAKYVVRKDETAYAHALREATILANRHACYHALGCAPGTSWSGVGYNWNTRPWHCYSYLDDSRLVARACVKGWSGAYYWSAHYR